jgi:sec-independent protein translocase protein TatA
MGISIWQLLILLAVVILVFGTKKLKNVGGDLGAAIKSFKSAVKDGDAAEGGGAQQDKVTQDSTEHSAHETTGPESVKKDKV